MKAILVMEMPDNCMDCPCGDGCGETCWAKDKQIGTYEDNYTNGQYERPKWCPLVPMPERKANNPYHNDYENGYTDGYNACLDTIEGSKGWRNRKQ